ncbi:OmpA family protein [Sandaracinus amylolyticus]|uniref:Flagellar motor rotation protein MotB n=1 Tax=Sandaracinus amylolyticus TaxID=927083 RepID=A0A0F6SDY4_9BACT|nr:OmpA family protein [Sandaracinus amylolyticus]AKF04249.1 Flagellar motor rotation protein MotB [Sandaracinus amylolyticus]
MFARDEEEDGERAPVWPAFGDMMACLFGMFALFFTWAVVLEVGTAEELREERARAAEERARAEADRARAEAERERLAALERALAGPLAAGRISLEGGRIGIRGSVLFDLNSSELKAEGRSVLTDVAAPLAAYLDAHDAMIMVSGFTDDLPRRAADGDNWQLSAERALTVVRALIAAGVSRDRVFGAGFGETHPVAPNDTDENRARNRRVEIAPVPRMVGGAW